MMFNILIILISCLSLSCVFIGFVIFKFKKDYTQFKTRVKDDQFLLMKNEKIIFSEINKIIAMCKNIEIAISGVSNKLTLKNDQDSAKSLKAKLVQVTKLNNDLMIKLKYLLSKKHNIEK